MSAIAQTDRQLGRHGNPSLPCYSPLSARSGPDPLGGYRHPSNFGQQTAVSPCGLPFVFPPTDRSGPVRLFRRWIAGLDGWRPQRQTRGFELEADTRLRKLTRDYADENSCVIFGPDYPTTNPYNPSVIPMSSRS